MKRRSTANKQKPLGAVIAIGNQKGGAGKTTVTVNLAAALGESGHKVLIIDLDPSAGATKHLGVGPYAYEGTVEFLTQQTEPGELAITEEMPRNVSLITGRDELASAPGDRIKQLKAILPSARASYDFILLDTPPNPKSPNTLAAYGNAEWFLFATLPDTLSVDGLSEAIRDISTIRQRDNPDLEILGVVFNAVNTRSLALKNTRAFLRKHKNLRPFGVKGFIPYSVYPDRAAAQGKTLFQITGSRLPPLIKRFRYIARTVAKRCSDRDGFLASVSTGQGTARRKRA